jgi:hypothetical protein
MRYCTLSAFFLLGTVDIIEDGLAVVELARSDYIIDVVTLPTLIFPCEIKEGDMFYFLSVDGVTEIRCGELPE